MSTPFAVTQLLEELREEHIVSDVEILRHSEAVIYPDADAVEDETGIRLGAADCRLLFASPATVERLIEALNNEAASLALFDVTVSADVLEALERGFSAVDEG